MHENGYHDLLFKAQEILFISPIFVVLPAKSKINLHAMLSITSNIIPLYSTKYFYVTI